MKHVIYFHGFASSPNSNKVLELRKHYDNVFAPMLPISYFPEYLAGQVLVYLRNNAKSGDEILFVGTSLGGYWAALMAEQFDGKAVVFNPSVDPSYDLMKYVGKNTNYSTGETFELDSLDVLSFLPLPKAVNEYASYAVICTKDKDVSVENSTNFFKDNAVFVVSDDHQFKDMEMFLKYVEMGFESIKSDNLCNGDFLIVRPQ